jgi:large subunit ribosomal protein L17
MRHKVDGRKFGRNTSHRLAMFKNMAAEIVLRGQVVTTLEKAKEVRRVVDKLITKAKNPTLDSKRRVFGLLRNKEAVQILFNDLGPAAKTREGGYTRVLKLSKLRRGDAAQQALIQIVDYPESLKKTAAKAEAVAEEVTAESENTAAETAIPTAGINPLQKSFKGFKKK